MHASQWLRDDYCQCEDMRDGTEILSDYLAATASSMTRGVTPVVRLGVFRY